MSNPVVLRNVGDKYTGRDRVLAIVWDVATSDGDRVEVRHIGGDVFWSARTTLTSTYLGLGFGEPGIEVPNGLELTMNDGAGVLLLYLKKN